MRKVAIYARISQDRSGLQAGVDRQLKDCRELAQVSELEVIEEIVDNDVSATTGKRRRGWTQLVELIENGAVSGIVVWHTDRLYRKVRDLVVLLDLADKYNLKIYAVTAGDINLSDPTGRMFATMIAGVASFEVEQKAARSARKNFDTARQGKFHGGPIPMGYRKGPTPGTLEIDEKQAETLRRAAGRLIAGETLSGVTRWARVELARPSLKPNSLKDALTRPTIAGLRRHVPASTRRDWNLRRKQGEVSGDLPDEVDLYTAEWDAILDHAEWTHMKSILLDGARRRGRPAVKSLLSGLLICEVCETKLGYSAASYKCPGPDRNGCSGVAISTKTVEAVVTAFIRAGLASTLPDEPIEAPVVANEAVFDELASRRNVLLGQFARGRITETELDEQLDQLTLMEAKLQATVMLKQQSLLAEGRARRVDTAGWDDADLQRRREIIRAVFNKGITIFKSPKGRKSGSSFNSSRIYFGPPPWKDPRLTPEAQQFELQNHKLRLAGMTPLPPVSPIPPMSIYEATEHKAAFRSWQREMDKLME
ncbi:hypothetical protein C3B61_03375 [Cryobacterium zongtaii]|uniref:Recombinase family protein n=1 Tax=Cryobacterium zongtaii TaxID=1259217 RepID=A0A2S3ZKS7_9MICO|nr:recombinase family protein [Cryobacterium zongtaii]POH68954.1 hypothetical protein C3B61_03375 [Cryobacterium zongtaii]